MDLRELGVRVRRTSNRVHRWTRILRLVLRERRFQLVVLISAAIVLINWYVVETTGGTVVARLASVSTSLLVTFLAVYLSVDVALPYLKYSERQRIGETATVLDAYPDSLFLSFEDASLVDSPLPGDSDEVAAVPEEIPDPPTRLSEVDYTVSDEMYELPQDVRGILEPNLDEMREIFNLDGNFSQLKARLDDVEGEQLTLSKTTYYRSFLTNFLPEYDVGGGRTVRQLLAPHTVVDGQLTPLSGSPLSNHLGGAGLVVTPEGTLLLSSRSGTVAVDKHAQSLSFSGALEYHDFASGLDFPDVLLNEMDEELNIPTENAHGGLHLGVTRRMERLGKPDVVAVVLLEDSVSWRNATEELTEVRELDIPGVDSVDSVEQLLRMDTAERILDTIAKSITYSDAKPTIGLQSFLILYAIQVEKYDQSRS